MGGSSRVTPNRFEGYPLAHAPHPIAIVGMGCRYPGAENASEFWATLRDGRDRVGPMPPERFGAWERFAGKIAALRGGFLTGLDLFDAAPFGISPREAAFIDPQQRLLLEVAWETLESAGVPIGDPAAVRTGVFVGEWLSDYETSMYEAAGDVELYMLTGAGRHSAAGRLSHVFNLHGPSLTLDTGCSSSLVAVHLACQSLRAGECDLALAGGVNVILQPPVHMAFSQAAMLSPEGRCKFGDASADGFVRSEGCGLVALKLLDRALADGDPVIAVILATAVGHDGRTGLFMTPSGEAQADMQRRACVAAGIAPRQVQYVEAHGTGTGAGDPVELKALGASYGRERTEPLWVGSVKTNIGHTEAAAGVAGLIKTALALKHRLIPASLHYRHPNPAVAWSELGLAIAAEARPWPGEGPAIAGVNSFGVAGTNAHVIVAEPAFAAPPAGENRSCAESAAPECGSADAFVLPLSAHSDETLRALAARWRDWLAGTAPTPQVPALGDVCHTAAVRRAHRERRLAVVGRSRDEIAARLDALLRGEPAEGLIGPERAQKCGGVAFVFSGQGPQWHAMGRGLMEAEPLFRETVGRCDAWLRREAGWSLVEELARGAADSRIDRTDITQPALFALQVGLARLWRSWGIVPDALVGHSSGEVAAACAAGALSLEDGLRVIVHRGRLQQTIAGRGRMLVTDLKLDEAERLLARVGGRVTVATVNSARSLTLAGDPEAIATLEEQLDGAGRFARVLRVDIASHSPHMEPLMAELAAAVGSIAPRPTEFPLVSTVTGAASDGARLGPDYWALNIRRPVMFKRAMEELIGRGVTTFIEISPHPVLASAMGEVLAEAGVAGLVLPSLNRNADEPAVMRETLGRLYCRGHAVDWRAICRGRVVDLPAYPWLRERCWFEDVIAGGGGAILGGSARPAADGSRGNPLLGRMVAPADDAGAVYFEAEVSARRLPHLGDHRVGGAPVLAGALIAGAMLDAAAAACGAGPHRLDGLRLIEAVALPDDGHVELQWELRPGLPGSVGCRLFARRPSAEWTLRAAASIELDGSDDPAAGEGLPADIVTALEADGIATGEEFYKSLAAMGLEYGPAFRSVRRIWCGQGEAIALLAVSTEDDPAGPIAPTLVDGGLQALLGAIEDKLKLELRGDQPASFMLASVGSFELHPGDPSPELWVRARADSIDAGGFGGSVEWIDGGGVRVAVARDVRLQRLDGAPPEAGAERFYEVRWAAADLKLDEHEPVPGRWVVVADRGGVGVALEAALRARGGQCLVIPSEPGRMHRAAEWLRAGEAAPGGVVHLALLDETEFGETRRCVCDSTLALVQSLARLEVRARLLLVTRGAQPVGAAPLAGIHQSPLWGMGRAIQIEAPDLGAKLVDLDPSAPAEESARAILGELARGDTETQAAWRDGKRLVARLAEISAPEPDAGLRRPAHRACRLELTRPGSPENVALVPLRRRAPGAGEVEIRPVAGGLNFRDIWVALGMIADGSGVIGLECAGEVMRVGAGVDEFRPGDRVIALAPGAFASFVTVAVDCVAPLPPGLSFEAAATLPVAYLTAGYGLLELARLKPGETVLVHAASGGVGLAAVALARMVGARVIATAGRPAKRAWLQSAGIDRVFDSRTIEFCEQAMAATDGRGVDVVLNSLAGDFIAASLRALAAGGRFVELGKTGIWSPERMRAARPDCAYFPFDLLDVMRRDPPRVGRMLRQLAARIENGRLAPLPARVYPVEAAPVALRRMSEARHVGKVVLSLEGASGRAWLDRDGAYLVTGGLGGLGLATARWLFDRGARGIALVGRHEPADRARAEIDRLKQAGARVLTICADVAQRAELAGAIERAERELGPLRGVVHAAGVLADGLLAGQDEERFERVLATKADAAWHLHELTRERELDFFIMFSSTAALLGSAGQANHSAANAFMDCLAHLRRGQGLPALSINWGPWSRIGAAADPRRLEQFAEVGSHAIAPERGIAALDRLLDWNPPQACVARFDVGRLRERFAALARGHYFDAFEAEPAGARPGAAAPSGLLQSLAMAAPDERRGAVENFLIQQVAQVLRMSPSRIDTRRPFKALGLDSLTGLELRNRIERAVGLKLPASLIWNYPTIDELGPHLLDLMGLNAVAAPQPAEADRSIDDLLSDIENMSEDEARRQLVGE